MSSTRLERSLTNKVIAGVCGGIAEYLAIDPTLVRIFFAIATVFTGGLFFLVYLVLLFVMPLPGRAAGTLAASAGTTAHEVADSLRRAADEIGQSFRSPDPAAPGAEGQTAPTEPAAVDPAVRARETERRRNAFGYLLIAVGVVLFLGQAGVFRPVQWQLVWPLFVVGLGVFLLAQRVRS